MIDQIEQAVDTAMAIQGWKTREELVWMARHAARATFVIDVGCWRGRTTKLMAAVCRGLVVAVDHLATTYTGDTGRNEIIKNEGQPRILVDFTDNLEYELRTGKVYPVMLDGDEARKEVHRFMGLSRAEFAWIDGDHDYNDVVADILAYRPLMASGAIFAGHDYEPSFPGVMRAVNELCSGVERGPGTAWFCRIP